MLSGDDMICYLLFPEVLFHCIDKREKARSWRCANDSYGMDAECLIYFLDHFPTISCLLFCFCVGNTTSHWWQRHIVVSLKNVLRTMCLLPRALVGRPSRKTKRPQKMDALPPLLSVPGWLPGWLPGFAPSSLAHVAQRASGKVSSIKAS